MKAKLILIFLLFCFFSVGAQIKSANEQLPLHFFSSSLKNKPLLVYISGDGGWNNFSEELVQELIKKGFPVVALDAKKYFWKAKTPEQFAKDMDSIIPFYLEKWGIKNYVLIGYSFGADVAAFLPARISMRQATLKKTILISPSASTDFEVKIWDMLGANQIERKYKVANELKHVSAPFVLIFGSEEDSPLKRLQESSGLSKKYLPGSHHYEDESDKLAQEIVRAIYEEN